MKGYREKMSDFVTRMWNNPALRNVSVQKKENQILGFIKDNSGQLKGTFAKPDYFPDFSWDDIIRLLFTELTERVIQSMEPRMDGVIKQLVHQSFFDACAPDAHVEDVSPVRVKEFLMTAMRSKAMRDHIIQSLDAISYKIFDKYVPVALERRKVIYYEIIRRDRLDIPEQWIPSYLNFCTLFRPFFWHKIKGNIGTESMVSLSSVYRNKKTYDDTIELLSGEINQNMGNIPLELYRPGLDSWLNAEENPDQSGISKFISILVSRSQDIDLTQDRDRGAETPDKSWFNINRRTARFYGYDVKFLDELYQIASEEGW